MKNLKPKNNNQRKTKLQYKNGKTATMNSNLKTIYKEYKTFTTNF